MKKTNEILSKKCVIYAKKTDLILMMLINKKYKIWDHCHYPEKYRWAAHDIFNLRCKTQREIPVVFHNGSTSDYHFIIKELAKEFQSQFKCLWENTEKYITFSVTIK